MRRLIARLTITAAAIFLCVTAASAMPEGMISEQDRKASVTKDFDQKLQVFADPVPLNEDDLSQSSLGQLKYIQGWSLTSDHHQFGGFSTFLKTQRGIISVSDLGLWLQASFDADAEEPFSNATLTWQVPRKYDNDMKKVTDIESVLKLPYGYLVGYEQFHRFEQVTEPGGWAFTSDISSAVDFRGLTPNGGVEAMTWFGGNSILAFAERAKDIKGRLKAWILKSDRTSDNLWFKPPQNFYPTDAKTLPSGDILVLLRRFSLVEGAGAKLQRIPAETILPGATLVGEDVATLESPITVDNMEGLDIEVLADGRVRLYLMSDNNLSRLQRTLLMIFDYAPDGVTPK
ncbi:esterase-like activity of phytase family protein [Kordiimonas sediminis]|nr:esterase-like activity of phytase family protein [Kordiimonas sediminis]